MENVLLSFFCIGFLSSGLNFIISWPFDEIWTGFFVCWIELIYAVS